ncbi:unnamed protein product [Strongylus vulgaris]|uniref:Major sperm protein n=1 Tax=Strongylus vulgaris TaxID=40348 RepID=A0A3P7J849_STRVU|nr:unnamed protein product [Strongylus vulgaris]
MDWTGQVEKQTVWVMNRTSNMIAFKVKCSNNRAFWIKPVFGTIESGEAAEIEVHYNAKKTLKSNDKIVICTAKYSPENGPLTAFFKLPTTVTEDKEIRQRAAAVPARGQPPPEPAKADNHVEILRC